MRVFFLCFATAVAAFLSGCGGDRPIVVHGTVTVGGQTPDSGDVHFRPIEGTTGPLQGAPIVAGKYEIKGRGGVPPGTYRVEIVAKKKTGRKIRQDNGFEIAVVDEHIQISPPRYAGESSPLKEEVGRNGEINFELPAK